MIITQLDLIDDAIKIGLAALGGGLISVWASALASKRKRRREVEVERNAVLAKPIIAFIDEELELMEEARWRGLEGGGKGLNVEALKVHRVRYGVIRARVAALKNTDLAADFELFSKVLSDFMVATETAGYARADEVLREGGVVAGRLMSRLLREER